LNHAAIRLGIPIESSQRAVGIINIVKMPGFLSLGAFTPQNLWTSVALAPVAVAGTAFGIWLVKRISTALFYRVMYVVLFFVALKLTWDGVTGLMR
jgi:uncharacterized protein